MISYCSTRLYEAAPKNNKGLRNNKSSLSLSLSLSFVEGHSNPRELCQSQNVDIDHSLCNSHAYQPATQTLFGSAYKKLHDKRLIFIPIRIFVVITTVVAWKANQTQEHTKIFGSQPSLTYALLNFTQSNWRELEYHELYIKHFISNGTPTRATPFLEEPITKHPKKLK